MGRDLNGPTAEGAFVQCVDTALDMMSYAMALDDLRTKLSSWGQYVLALAA